MIDEWDDYVERIDEKKFIINTVEINTKQTKKKVSQVYPDEGSPAAFSLWMRKNQEPHFAYV